MVGRPLGFGELLDSGFVIYRKGFLSFVAITALAQVPAALLSLLVASGRSAARVLSPDFLLVSALSALLSVAMAGALVSYAATFFGFGEAGVGAAYRRTLRRYGRLLLFSVVYGLLILVGLFLFVIPGVVVGVAFSLGMPALLLEDIGVFEAFRRSLELARGAFWRLLGVFLVTFLIFFVGGAIVQIPFRGLSFLAGHGFGGVILPVLGSLVGNVLLAGLVEIMETVLYVDRRSAQEGTTFVGV